MVAMDKNITSPYYLCLVIQVFGRQASPIWILPYSQELMDPAPGQEAAVDILAKKTVL